MPGIADLTARTGGRADISARLRAALAADIGPHACGLPGPAHEPDISEETAALIAAHADACAWAALGTGGGDA